MKIKKRLPTTKAVTKENKKESERSKIEGSVALRQRTYSHWITKKNTKESKIEDSVG